MKVAVLGFGVVGQGVYEMLRTCPLFEAGPVLVRPGKADAPFKVDDIEKIVNDESVDAVAEVMGGVDVAYAYGVKALKAGKHFVTSNKALVSAKGVELDALAREKGVGFLFSAACGGAVPFLHNLELARQSDDIEALGGILNGTTNYMLDRMQSEGLGYEEALSEAQALGYAEADPTADVTGLDALRKIMLGCAVAYDRLPVEGLYNEGIDSLTAADVAHFQGKGLTCRLLAKGGLAEGKLYAYVQPALLPADAPECAVKKNFNMAKYLGKNSGQIVLMGQGAGRYPTASAVIRDLECIRFGQREMLHELCEYSKAENDGCLCTYYVRMPKACVAEFELAESEAQGGAVYAITKPISVKAMHEKVRALRKGGMPIFFAEI
ncbi:MAG: homoserine dehydrogenase [Oscillospiraceae bacterium]|nr:homoserine dehydrogenase [Oscillospiraceae bacterium]